MASAIHINETIKDDGDPSRNDETNRKIIDTVHKFSHYSHIFY